MGISGLAVCCGGALNACVGSDQGCDETGRPIAIGRTGVAQRRSNDTTAIEVSARVSIVVAGREPAKSKGRTGLSPQIEAGHEVSILIMAVDVSGR